MQYDCSADKGREQRRGADRGVRALFSYCEGSASGRTAEEDAFLTQAVLSPFEELGLSPEQLHALDEMGYERPTEIQSAVIPVLQAGRDVMGQAQTGTGKTAAFGIPLVEAVDAERDGVQALVLAPTRELALQITAELRALA